MMKQNSALQFPKGSGLSSRWRRSCSNSGERRHDPMTPVTAMQPHARTSAVAGQPHGLLHSSSGATWGEWGSLVYLLVLWAECWMKGIELSWLHACQCSMDEGILGSAGAPAHPAPGVLLPPLSRVLSRAHPRMGNTRQRKAFLRPPATPAPDSSTYST